MSQKLNIYLTGSSPALGSVETGVSLKFFADYAKRLRDAYQRSAQAELTGATQITGRLPKRAAEVDVRLVSARAGSLDMNVVPVDESIAPELATIGLAGRALYRMFDDLEQIHCKGDNANVSRWICELVSSVPQEITQRYRHFTNGSFREVQISSSAIESPDVEPTVARVDRFQCSVRGVLFTPKTAILLQTEEGKLEVTASLKLLEQALSQRERLDLIATVVTNSGGRRLLALRPLAEQQSRERIPPAKETIRRFDDLMKRLAQ